MSIIERMMKFYRKYGIFIIVFWLGFSILVGGPSLPMFIKQTKITYDPPPGTESYDGYQMMEKYFPAEYNATDLIFVIHSTDGKSLIETEQVKTYHDNLVQKLNSSLIKNNPVFISYWLLNGTEADAFKNRLISDDNLTAILIANVHIKDLKSIREKIPELRDIKDQNIPRGIEVYLTGVAPMAYDSEKAIEKDLMIHDAVAMPLIIILLVILLYSWRLLLLALLSLGIGVLSAFAVMNFITLSFNLTVLSFVPSIMFAVMLGAGVDYNLFLLSRFREEREKGKDCFNSTCTMMRTAGHNVFTSGITLAISFLALAMFPMALFASIGYAVFIAVIIGLLVSFTFTPSVLVLFGKWFYPFKKGMKKHEGKSIWTKFAKFGIKKPKTIILLTLILTLPVASFVIDTNPSSSVPSLAPIGSESNEGFKVMSKSFSPGILGPIDIIIDTGTPNGVWNETFFSAGLNFTQAIIQKTKAIDNSTFISPMYLAGNEIPYFLAIKLAFPGNDSWGIDLYNTSMGRQYREQVFPRLSKNDSIAFVSFALTIDPLSEEARPIIKTIRSEARTMEKITGYKIYVTGIGPQDIDMIDYSYGFFPYFMFILLIVIYILVGVMFKSALLPLRLIITIALTIFYVYGLAFFAFQEGWLAAIFPRYEDTNLIFWMIPIMSASILIGLGMDYDIFLVERVKEEVWAGKSDKEALITATEKTGRIITGAGTVMAVAFGGLLLGSSVPIIQEGFILTVAVLVDTYFVRTILVPAIMSLAERHNWWPTKPPYQQENNKENSVSVKQEGQKEKEDNNA